MVYEPITDKGAEKNNVTFQDNWLFVRAGIQGQLHVFDGPLMVSFWYVVVTIRT